MAGTQDIAARLVPDLMRELGLSREQALGLAGNLAHESMGFRDLTENGVKGRGGYGYAQWTGDRRTKFENYAKSQGLKPSSYEANLGFIVKELKGSEKSALKKIKSATTADQAASVAMTSYFRPGKPQLNSRQNWTDQFASSLPNSALSAINAVAPTPMPARPAQLSAFAPIQSDNMKALQDALNAKAERMRNGTDGRPVAMPRNVPPQISAARVPAPPAALRAPVLTAEQRSAIAASPIAAPFEQRDARELLRLFGSPLQNFGEGISDLIAKNYTGPQTIGLAPYARNQKPPTAPVLTAEQRNAIANPGRGVGSPYLAPATPVRTIRIDPLTNQPIESANAPKPKTRDDMWLTSQPPTGPSIPAPRQTIVDRPGFAGIPVIGPLAVGLGAASDLIQGIAPPQASATPQPQPTKLPTLVPPKLTAAQRSAMASTASVPKPAFEVAPPLQSTPIKVATTIKDGKLVVTKAPSVRDVPKPYDRFPSAYPITGDDIASALYPKPSTSPAVAAINGATLPRLPMMPSAGMSAARLPTVPVPRPPVSMPSSLSVAAAQPKQRAQNGGLLGMIMGGASPSVPPGYSLLDAVMATSRPTDAAGFAADVTRPSAIPGVQQFTGTVQQGQAGQNRFGSTARNELLALYT